MDGNTTMTFDPIPYLRWVRRAVPNYLGSLNGLIKMILQVGYRPINGGKIQWQDVPILLEGEDDDTRQST